MAALNKKGPVVASRRLAYVLESYSKHALLDLIADRARGELGEHAHDEDVMALVQSWMHPVAVRRGDKEIDLHAIDKKRERIEAEYRARQQKEQV